MEIGIIGAGNVGGTLGRRWAQAGHAVVFGVRDPNDERVRTLLAAAGAGVRAGRGQEGTYFLIIGIADPKDHRMPRLRPAAPERAADIACANDADFHHALLSSDSSWPEIVPTLASLA